jgi:hypothetical protein
MISNTRNRTERWFGNGDPDKERQDDCRLVSECGQTNTVDSSLSEEIDSALQEKDIIALRNNLKDIIKQSTATSGNEHLSDAEAYFGLSEEVFKPTNLNLDEQENEVGNYLQKLHIKNHKLAAKETVYDLFTDNEGVIEMDQLTMSAEDELLFEDIRDAVVEKEIIDLRANLQSIAQSITIHERTFEEIEDLVNGELDAEIENMIRQEAMSNAALSNEIDLQNEINSAIEEMDVMKLRNGLKEMMRNEYSHSRSIEEMDGYLNDELDEMTLALFEDELMNNSGLAADLAFQREIDAAAGESDVMALRANLQQISLEEKHKNREMLGVTSPRRKNLVWYAAASTIILMIVFSSLLRHKTYTGEQLYVSYYKPYKSGANVARSASVSANEMNTAIREIDRGNYTTALGMLQSASKTEQDGFSINFYSGVAYQELGEYRNAIQSFGEVVQHGDNLLVEQSEWYIGLCYLRIEEREKAAAQFKSIVSRNGFYREQSRILLKQIE